MLADALNRTMLLMRTDLVAETDDGELLAALTATRIVLEAREDALETHSGQSAFITAALLMARSGHEIWLDAPERAMIGFQPPLAGGDLVESLLEVGLDLLPGRAFHHGRPAERADVTFVFGAGDPAEDRADNRIAMNAGGWAGSIDAQPTSWRGALWPMGGMATGALAAAEAFKLAMRRLRGRALAPDYFDLLYAPCAAVEVRLAAADTLESADLPNFDLISGGAIANAVLFVLHRLPAIKGTGRVLDDDRSALSNLNRNALLVRSALGERKVDDLARFGGDLSVHPEPVRFEEGMPLAETVLIGVDDIPSRWAAQRAGSPWLGVGATESFNVLVSSHEPDQACVGCLHPMDGGLGGAIPTAAFVSFWSGLLLVSRWLRELTAASPAHADQQLFLNALRPESWAYGATPVGANAACPVECRASTAARLLAA